MNTTETTHQADVGLSAPSFNLPDENGKVRSLQEFLKQGPLLIAFYPGDFTKVCTSQLCNYRDRFDDFKKLGIQVVGISDNTPGEHQNFSKEYQFPFPLLTDSKKEVAKLYGCTSLLMFGGVSRAVFILSAQGQILYRHVEPTVLTRRKADELMGILTDLRQKNLL